MVSMNTVSSLLVAGIIVTASTTDEKVFLASIEATLKSLQAGREVAPADLSNAVSKCKTLLEAYTSAQTKEKTHVLFLKAQLLYYQNAAKGSWLLPYQSVIDTVLTADHHNMEALLLKGAVYLQRHDVNNAMVNFNKAIKLANKDPQKLLLVSIFIYSNLQEANFKANMQLIMYPITEIHELISGGASNNLQGIGTITQKAEINRIIAGFYYWALKAEVKAGSTDKLGVYSAWLYLSAKNCVDLKVSQDKKPDQQLIYFYAYACLYRVISSQFDDNKNDRIKTFVTLAVTNFDILLNSSTLPAAIKKDIFTAIQESVGAFEKRLLNEQPAAYASKDEEAFRTYFQQVQVYLAAVKIIRQQHYVTDTKFKSPTQSLLNQIETLENKIAKRLKQQAL